MTPTHSQGLYERHRRRDGGAQGHRALPLECEILKLTLWALHQHGKNEVKNWSLARRRSAAHGERKLIIKCARAIPTIQAPYFLIELL